MPKTKVPVDAMTLEEHKALGAALSRGARQIFRYTCASDMTGTRRAIAIRALREITALQQYMNELLWTDYRDALHGTNHREIYYGKSDNTEE